MWSRVTFYSSYIAPHFNYCITVWGSWSDSSRLLKLQKQAAHAIMDCDFTVPSRDMFCKLKWLSIKEWVKYRKVMTVYKALNGYLPAYLGEMFQTVNNVHSRCTRQSAKQSLYLPQGAKLNAYRNSLRYSGAQIYNFLPAEIRSAPSCNVFKHRYLKNYFTS